MDRKPHTKVRFFSGGYCTANSKHVFPAEKPERIRFYAIWALIQHPELGNILFDTGYHKRFFEATRRFPDRIYRWVTPVNHLHSESCISKLESINIKTKDIQHIVISHFHADHIAGLLDFPDAQIWCTKAALDFTLSRNRVNGVVKGVLKELLPGDIRKRTKYPESECGKSRISNLSVYGWSDDMFFVDLPGHFKGQTGLLIRNTNHGDLLLCADAAWSVRAIHEKIYPARIVSIFIDSYSELSQTIDSLHDFQLENQNVRIVPTHCQESLKLIDQFAF